MESPELQACKMLKKIERVGSIKVAGRRVIEERFMGSGLNGKEVISRGPIEWGKGEESGTKDYHSVSKKMCL